ncbi:hypothetical protein SGGMMB4_00434 [Sodalis glossinidius str. 'morsitans']|uniref:Uncharacterized protein n=1 Tax=Sodalis glossinidius (strain morsitans) TaxID=343509 RepID=A0A193QF63_SODGM|nr:hypothetical protein SGGMMB4_00434 [Sodalis glossinidius str. 'morsitans']
MIFPFPTVSLNEGQGEPAQIPAYETAGLVGEITAARTAAAHIGKGSRCQTATPRSLSAHMLQDNQTVGHD